MQVSLRPAKIDDVTACGAICYEAFKAIADQHRFPTDFPDPQAGVDMLSARFTHQDVYAAVAEIDGRVVGSVCLWERWPIAGIGPLTVDPVAQNSSVGRRLMEHVLERTRDKGLAGVRLVQDAFHGRSLALYSKLGFDAREPLSLFQGQALGVAIPGHAVRLATAADQEACNGLCRRVHGYARAQELLEAIQEQTATVVERGGRIAGYATVLGFSGHAVGENNEALKALISAAPAFQGPGFLVPTRNGELLRFCLDQGLRIIKPMTLMSQGLYNEPSGAFLPSIIS